MDFSENFECNNGKNAHLTQMGLIVHQLSSEACFWGIALSDVLKL